MKCFYTFETYGVFFPFHLSELRKHQNLPFHISHVFQEIPNLPENYQILYLVTNYSYYSQHLLNNRCAKWLIFMEGNLDKKQ